MRNFTRDISTRMVLAGTLIAASFFSSYFIAASANHSQQYWSAQKTLVPGSFVSTRDVEAISVSLSHSGDKYLAAQSLVIGALIVRRVEAGELLPSVSISTNKKFFDFASVPISVRKSDLPKDLLEGELVNIYQVGSADVASTVVKPQLVLSKVFVTGIDKTGTNMGGSETITLSTRVLDVLKTLDATAMGRLVVIRVHG